MNSPGPDVVLLKLPGDGAEQFVMMSRGDLFPDVAPGQPPSHEQWMEQFGRLLHQPRLTERGVRDALLRRGLSAREIDAQLTTARLRFAVMTSQPTRWDHLTRIGSRNADGQEIMKKTDTGGPEGQRIFVLRCTVCEYEYGAYGIDADIRRCPACQDGPAGLPVPK